MKVTPSTAAAAATVGLGLSQALVPKQAGQVFGLGEITDGRTIWLARMLGVANITLGSLGLDESIGRKVRPQQIGLLAGNAAVTGLAVAKGNINKRTGASVLGFIALLAYSVVATKD
jgi:hypothetical protein